MLPEAEAEMELELGNGPGSTQTKASKVYVRHYDFTAYYEIDRVLPTVLDPQENGGIQAIMTNDEWLLFCDKMDDVFERLNMMQCINFYCDLLIGIMLLFYLILVYLIYVVPPRISFIYFVLLFAAINTVFHFYIGHSVTRFAVKKAERLCEEETRRLLGTLRTTPIVADMVFHYRKRHCWNCEGYEIDRKERNRYHEVFVEIKITGPASAIGYAGDMPEAAVVDECYNGRDVEGVPVATATEIRAEQYTNTRADAPLEPYVTTPMAAAAYISDIPGTATEQAPAETIKGGY